MSEATAFSYTVSRGGEVDVVLTPHRHKDGKFVASMTRFEKDYVRVETLRELLILAKAGFRIRMSDPKSVNHKAPSLISLDSLQSSSRSNSSGA